MSRFESSLGKLLRSAAEQLDAGQKDAARELLREALGLDRNNLATWELLWRAAYTREEELSSVKHILKIDPRHAAAKKRLLELQPGGLKKGDSQPLSRNSSRRPVARKQRQQAGLLLSLLGALIAIVCVSITGFALIQGGYVPFLFSSSGTATALAEKNASCQALIDRTIQASSHYCDNTASNTTCYGNSKLNAEVEPGAQRFSEPGDTLGINKLKKLTASPLNLASDEWGIAVFKIVANLPRSLPGQTVSMVVFGNATLNNQQPGSDSLESFYFSSELGQIVCEKIPFDGLMISSPDGSGIRFTVNGSELTLMGNASIKAIKNEKMEVSVYKGSARIVSNGKEQYFGAGQKVSVQLGGDNGSQSISPPSAPQPITGGELTMSCTMTGAYCSPSEIRPVTELQAQAQIQSEITSTPTLVPTETITRTPSPTEPPTFTPVVLPSRTPTRTITPTATRTKPSTATKTPIPIRTNTPTRTITLTPTLTFTPTNTTIPTSTPLAPSEPICKSVSHGVLTNPNPNEISIDIANSSGTDITINRFFAFWVKSTSSQKISRLLLNSAVIWNTSDPTSPSDFPAESPFSGGANLTIANGIVQTLVIQFQNDLQPPTEVHIVFDIGCQVIGTQ